jgi:hypothetical protein
LVSRVAVKCLWIAEAKKSSAPLAA